MKNLKMSQQKENEITPKKIKLDDSLLNNNCSGNEFDNSLSTPSKSRFGRSHKPKMLGDFLSTDKKVSAVLKVNPRNQIKYFMESGRIKSPKKDKSPKKSPVKTSKLVMKLQLMPPSTMQSEDIKVEASELEPVPGCEWMVGDLAWARVGNHPFWPCIVNIDPACKIFTRIRMFSRSLVPLRALHVQFFGDNGRRSWLFSSAVMNYTGREAFENLAKSILSGMKRKDPRQVSALIVKPHLRSIWENAVNEAESLLSATREERVLYFRKLYPIEKILINQLYTAEQNGLGTKDNVGPKKRGRKRKAELLSGDTIKAPKQMKLEKYLEDQSPKQEEEDPKSKTLSPKKLSILDRIKLSQKSSDSEEARSPSLRLKKKKEEEDERKRVEEKQKKIDAQKKRDEAKAAEKEAAKKEEHASMELRRTRSENSEKLKDKIKKKKKKSSGKFGTDFRVFMNKHFDRVLDEHPNMKEKDVEKYLEKMWLDMDEHQKLRYRPRINANTSASKVSEDESDDSESTTGIEDEDTNSEERTSNSSEKSSSPVPLALATSRSGIGKRSWSLFNGAIPGKVCQICEKPVDTLRCKGLCSGTYHLECALNPLQMSARRQELKIEFKTKSPRKKKEKRGRKKSNVLLGESKNNSNAKEQTETSEDIDDNILNDKTDEKENDSLENEKNVTNDGKISKENAKEESSLNVCGGINKNLDGDVSDYKKTKKEEKETSSEEGGEDKENASEKLKNIKNRGKGSKDSNESGEEVEGQGEFRCPDCSESRIQPCFFCGLEEKNGDKIRIRCHIAHCGKVYHAECLKAWPQTSWTVGGKRGSLVKADKMTCPQHSCHTCVSDNPGAIKARFQNDKLVRCLRCPTSYHYGNHCLPAGSEVITSRQIICPKHYRPQKRGTHHVNAAWCFICASVCAGGSLICCDLCPTAFHADCLKISTPEGGYVCEDCETGRFPLYGEVVWVKLGSYRWWPAQILFPYQIPDNIYNLPHSRGEFAVRFFGSHDHYWVNRGRVFLYQEGDSGKGSSKHSQTDQVFFRAVQEASVAFLKLKDEKSLRDAETRPGMKPPTYIKIKTNKPVGAVRMMETNISSMTPCECDTKSPNPCAPDSDCLNRILMVECNPLICPAGDRCNNQMFEKREYPPLIPYRTDGRGWGLKTLADLKKGQFVIEYVGEMIDEEEYQKRLQKMHQSNDENYYFLTIDKDRMLDAGPKGNVARFMNHSCQPNCETQKWTVNGDTRVGLFALTDIAADTELVFNYNLESIGTDKKPCMCGAVNCSGFIGVKVTKNNGDDDKKAVQMKKSTNKKAKLNKSSSSDDVCFMCGEGGELLLCDSKACPKGYHLSCLKRTKWPQGKWLCPWHQCNICNKGKVKRCTFCVNSYCPNHVEGNIRLDDSVGLVCSKHDNKAEIEENFNDKKKSEQLGVEVDSSTEVEEVLSSEDPSDLGSDSVTPEVCAPLSSSSLIPSAVSDSGDSDDKVKSKSDSIEIDETFKEKNKTKETIKTTEEELTELVVNKPNREYRNKRLRSSSDLINSISSTVSASRRKRPVSVDSPISLASTSNKSVKDRRVSKITLEEKIESFNEDMLEDKNKTVKQTSIKKANEDMQPEEKSAVEASDKITIKEKALILKECDEIQTEIIEPEVVSSNKESYDNAENLLQNKEKGDDESIVDGREFKDFKTAAATDQSDKNLMTTAPTNESNKELKNIHQSLGDAVESVKTHDTPCENTVPNGIQESKSKVSVSNNKEVIKTKFSIICESSVNNDKGHQLVEKTHVFPLITNDTPVVFETEDEQPCLYSETSLGTNEKIEIVSSSENGERVGRNLSETSCEVKETVVVEKSIEGKISDDIEGNVGSTNSAKEINILIDAGASSNLNSVPDKDTLENENCFAKQSSQEDAANVVSTDRIPPVKSLSVESKPEEIIHTINIIESEEVVENFSEIQSEEVVENVSEIQGTKCSNIEKDNSTVKYPSVDESVISSNSLSIEKKEESFDSSLIEDMSFDIDKDIVVNGSCTVSSSSISV